MKGRTAFITGAGGGIGRAIAVSLAKEGVYIVLFGGNNIAKLNETLNEIKSVGGDGIIFSGNLADDSVLDTCFENAIKSVGEIDILINNAGLAYSGSFEKTDKETLDKLYNINARVPFLLTQKALPYLYQSEAASIINIASVVSHAGYPLQSAYAMSKHALLGFTKSLAAEVYDKGIRVHAISPGGVYTDMVKVSRPDLTSEGMIVPQDIADIVLFLLKNRGNAVIDEILVHRQAKPPFLV